MLYANTVYATRSPCPLSIFYTQMKSASSRKINRSAISIIKWRSRPPALGENPIERQYQKEKNIYFVDSFTPPTCCNHILTNEVTQTYYIFTVFKVFLCTCSHSHYGCLKKQPACFKLFVCHCALKFTVKVTYKTKQELKCVYLHAYIKTKTKIVKPNHIILSGVV